MVNSLGVVYLAISAAIICWAVFAYNRLVRDRNRIPTAWSDIDIQLKRRYDLIPKLVAAVEQYARYERATLSTIIELRRGAQRTTATKEKAPIEGQISTELHKIMLLVEAYPELKADQSFLQLQSELTEVENHIQFARRFYNGTVRNFNTRIDSFPDLLIARLFRYTPQPFFELDASTEMNPREILSK